MEHAESFRDLVVYQKARAVARRFFELSKAFPMEERYSLTDQGRRSSRSVGGQIAEAWAKRAYEKHFVSKLTDADGEQQETQHWVDTALDCGYLPQETRDELVDELQRIGRMLQSMMDKSDLFCGSRPACVRESAAEYFTHRSPSTDHRPPTTDHRPPMTDHGWRPAVNGNR
jgi:four helix bundle protein